MNFVLGFLSFFWISTGSAEAKELARSSLDMPVKTAPRDTSVLELPSGLVELEEVTVEGLGAQRRREEVSIISFISEDFIRRNRSGSLMKSLERIPGISSIGVGSGASKPQIRGLGFNRVMVVERGLKHEGQQWGADHGLEVDQYGIGEVILIKGPASVRYGSDAIGGVLDIQASNYPERNTAGGELSMGTQSNMNWAGGSGHIYYSSDHWWLEARLTAATYGDFRVPTDTVHVYNYPVALDQNRVRNTAGTEQNWAFNWGYKTSRLRNVLSLSRVSTRAGFFANAHGLEPRAVNTELHDQSSTDILLPMQEVSHLKVADQLGFTFDKALLELDMGWQINDRSEWGQYVNHGFMPANYPSDRSDPADLERAFDKSTGILNARSDWFLNRHQLQVGLGAEYQRNKIGGWGFLIPAHEKRAIGLYALDKWRWTEQWLIEVAARFDYHKINIEAYQDWFPSSTSASPTPGDYLYRANELERQFSSIVGSIGLTYTPGTWTYKGSFGTAYRVPLAQELGANGVNYHYYRFERGNANLDPERSFQLDLEANYQTEKLTFDFSPYLNYFTNYIYLNPSAAYDYLYGAGNQVFNYQQAQVIRYGAEFHVDFRLLPQLHLDLGGEVLYSQQVSGSKKGYSLPFSPPASMIAGIEKSFRSTAWLTAPFIGIDYRLTARQNRIVPPEKTSPAYQLLSIKGGGDLILWGQQMTLNFQVQNVLNTGYMNHTSFYRLIDLPEQGRNLVFSLLIPFQL